MRPALEGFAGIPQETRLLFHGLRKLENLEVEGMIQTSHRVLAKGTTSSNSFFKGGKISEARKVNRYSRVIISVSGKPFKTVIEKVLDFCQRNSMSASLGLGTLLGYKTVKLSNFRAKYFEDFLWRTLFSKTLPASEFNVVATADQRICSTPWHVMHLVGLSSLNFLRHPLYPKLDTKGIDVFIGQTPYPGRVDKKTAFVIRYHDALPVFMPHTIPDKSIHQATHFYALASNVRSGAYICCVSQATKDDLVKLFPEAESKAVVIHNMVSHHYFPEESPKERVPGIIRARLHEGDKKKGVEVNPTFLTLREQENFYKKHLVDGDLKYLLIVSTVEPRKNHTRLLAAWEVIKADERAKLDDKSALAGVAQALPALERAAKLQKRAARTGFDWPNIEGPKA